MQALREISIRVVAGVITVVLVVIILELLQLKRSKCACRQQVKPQAPEITANDIDWNLIKL